MSDAETTLSELRSWVRTFVEERDWGQFHSPKNLSMAIAIEAAELMEEFQWLTIRESWEAVRDEAGKSRVVAELADVFIYCLSLANALEVDISEAVRAKLHQNARKYPVEAYRGRF